MTPREREILRLVAAGWQNLTIAAQLKVSPRTIEVPRANLYRKLRVRNTVQLLQAALSAKLITFP